MNKKLLHKTLRAYLLYFVVILLIAAPVFYYTIQQLYITEADDTLRLHRKEFVTNVLPQFQQQDIAAWNRYNRNVKIDSAQSLRQDSIFYSNYYDTLDDELEPYRELKVPVTIQGTRYTYSERINLVESEDLIRNIALLFLSIIIILLVGLFAITKRLSQQLWRPFYTTLQQIEQFEIDKNKQPAFSPTSIEEFSRLNKSIEKLVEKNSIIYKNQREFIENAAHELQTPLAVFQAKIDTLLQQPGIAQPQLEMLSSLNDNVSRLNRLNKNLLLLSKIDNDSYIDKQTISLPAFIEKNIDFFTEQASAKQLSIDTTIQSELSIQANSVLTEILINNLILNAIRHNVPNGKIKIQLQDNQLIVSNTGIAVALHKEKLFNRFSKVNPSEQGSGLGLSIVKKIADSNHWQVAYSYSDQWHRFSIRF